MKAETNASKDLVVEAPADTLAVSRDGSNAESTTDTNSQSSSGSEDDSGTVQASTASIKSAAGKEPAKSIKDEGKKPEGSLVGKINNLVTTDLGALRRILSKIYLTRLYYREHRSKFTLLY